MQATLFNDTDNILPFDGEVILYPHFFSAAESDHYLDLLTREINWKQEAIKIYGKEVMQPRLTAWYGDANVSYSYSGITMRPQAWTNALKEIKEKIEITAGLSFTGALLNLYRSGKDSMGWHRGNEKELGSNPVIGSVNFGVSRTFIFRHYREKQIKRSVDLTHGSFLLMKGETQHCWEHQLPRRERETGVRINITFRVVGAVGG